MSLRRAPSSTKSMALARTGARRKKNTKLKPSLWQRLADHPALDLFFRTKVPQHLSVVPPDPWSGSAAAGRALLQHKFSFNGQEFSGNAGGSPVPWKPDGAGPDWLAALHGFEWLRDLRALGGDPARRQARLLVRDWMTHHKRWDPLAWRPDIVGNRLAAWIGLHDFFLDSADDGYRRVVFDSIQKQSRYLARSFSGPIRGAAMMAALRGQIYACLALPGQQTRLFQALAVLHDEIRMQILPDGGHIERNPSSHADVLRYLIDIRAGLRCAGLMVPDGLHNAIHTMAPMLRFYRHGDGYLALFNGSDEGDTNRLDMILQQAHAAGRAATSAPHTGYKRMTLGRSVVVFDVGTAPPTGYNTHAHAAPLAFEFSVARERLVVNCGHSGSVGAHTPLALALRQTAAHSAVTVANTNAMEIRADGTIGRAPRTIHIHEEVGTEQILVAATHDGYHANLGVVHKRQLYLGDNGEDLRGQDSLVGTAGHPFSIRFHLAPDIKASMTGNNAAVLLRLRSGAGWRFRASGATISLEESLYAPHPDEKPKRNMQIVLKGHTSDHEALIKWSFKREKKPRTNGDTAKIPLIPVTPVDIT